MSACEPGESIREEVRVRRSGEGGGSLGNLFAPSFCGRPLRAAKSAPVEPERVTGKAPESSFCGKAGGGVEQPSPASISRLWDSDGQPLQARPPRLPRRKYPPAVKPYRFDVCS